MSKRSSVTRRLPSSRGLRLKPMCGQCGREMSGTFPRQSDELRHILRTGVALNLRLFAESSDPHACGAVLLRITDEGITFGWLDGNRGFAYAWADLMDIAQQWDEIAAASSAVDFAEWPE